MCETTVTTDTDVLVCCPTPHPPSADRHLKHQREISYRKPRCWRHMVLIHIRARFFKHSLKLILCTVHATTYVVCVSFVVNEMCACFSGCVWEPSFPRLHAVRFCCAPGKQESAFSQMVSNMCSFLLREPVAAQDVRSRRHCMAVTWVLPDLTYVHGL